MKAIRVTQWGEPVQLEAIPQPTPGRDEVLLHVHAASINPVDVVIAAGSSQARNMLTLPITLGTDFSGEVVAVGTEVKHVQPGEAVYGMIPFRGGAFAQYSVVKANEVALKPTSLNDVQAATVPLPALTAWQALFDYAQLQKGERVLIHGAGGSVGSFAVQFAKEKGAYVIGTASGDKAAFVRSLGVDQDIDYQALPFDEVVHDVDVVLDTVGGDTLQHAYKVLKAGGRFVTTVGRPAQEEAEHHNVRVYGIFTQPNADQLTTIAELIDAGKVKVFVHRIFPLEEAQAALELHQKEKKRGKIVLAVT